MNTAEQQLVKGDKNMSKCPYAKKCSGCQLQNLTYDEQLKMKQVKLINLLGKYGHVSEIIGMNDPGNYRNKLQRAFAYNRGRLISGIYQSASYRIAEVDECMLEDKISSKIVDTVRALCPSFKIKAYDLNTGSGFLRHILVRRGFVSGEIMVVLVTARGEFKSRRSFVNELLRRHPEITTLVWNINTTNTPLMLGERSEILYGDGYITDTLCGLSFRISPRSFYQINHTQTEVLYSLAKKYADLDGSERVIDAYCGTGTIGLTMADKARELIGVEVNGEAVRDAKDNAERNGIKNASFYEADAGDFMSELAKKGEDVDVVITDPPRAGCSMRFLRSLISLSPKKIVYISCDPETLARDLNTLTKNGYTVKKIQGVDMFPFTRHVESVVCLSRETTHEMKLHASPFEMIKSGQKTIELRLYDEKRQQIKEGDTIIFTNTVNGEKMSRKVKKLQRFDSFEELYKSLPLLQCVYTVDDVDNAKPSDMDQYYSVEKQDKYGVVGIELFPPKRITDETIVCLRKQ